MSCQLCGPKEPYPSVVEKIRRYRQDGLPLHAIAHRFQVDPVLVLRLTLDISARTPQSERAKLKETALDLLAYGYTAQAVGEMIGRSGSSVTAWRREAERA